MNQPSGFRGIGVVRGTMAALAVCAAMTVRPAVAGDPAAGRALAERWCTGCHLIGADGPGSDMAPPFHAIASDPTKSREGLVIWLATPHTNMPNLGLSRLEIEDLVSYIVSLRP